MRVLINAISIREGGSKVALLSFLRHFAECHEHIFYVSLNSSARSWELPDSHNLIFLFTDAASISFVHLFYWYNVRLPLLLHQHSIDALFSLTNYLPILPIRSKSLLLVQHAGHFSDAFRSCLRREANGLVKSLSFSLKTAWVYLSVYRATSVTVQTSSLRLAIIKALCIRPDKIHVVPHGPGLMISRSGPRRLNLRAPVYSVGYVAKPGAQKNFFPLVDSLKIIKENGFNVKLHLTMPDDHPQTRAIEDHSKSIGVGHLLVNHGDIDKDRVTLLYRDIDLFLFPSLCESFGFPLVEAMCSALPTIVSNTSSNLELVPKGSCSFPPHDGYSIATSILELLSSPSKYLAASKASLKRSLDFSWEIASFKTIQLLNTL